VRSVRGIRNNYAIRGSLPPYLSSAKFASPSLQALSGLVTLGMATTSLLEELEALWPTATTPNSTAEPSIPNPYALIAAVVFGSANLPELVPSVWVHAASRVNSNDDKALLARRMRDALFKTGMLTGYSRTINAMLALHAEMPEEFRAARFGSERGIDWPEGAVSATATTTTDGLLVPGAPQPALDQVVKHGRSYFGELYGDTASTTQAMLDAAYPDLGEWCWEW